MAAAKKKMPAFTKPTAATVEAFDDAIGPLPDVERRLMFGYPAAFINGNMMASIFQNRIMLRLSEADRREALAIPGARQFEPMPGRAMKEYIELPPELVARKTALRVWFQRARACTATMPPKKKANQQGKKRKT
jgi:TfoX/Sxy family transcriptional regulator of competence genes